MALHNSGTDTGKQWQWLRIVWRYQ